MSQPPDPQALRKKLLDDPTTEQIANELGVSLEEYIEQVLHFAMNPEAVPDLYLVEDEELRKMGYEPHTADEIGRYLLDYVAVATATEKTDFSETEKKKLDLAGGPLKAEPALPKSEELQSEAEKIARIGRAQK
jgi:hypothetical protein